jgi:hypothetical protein
MKIVRGNVSHPYKITAIHLDYLLNSALPTALVIAQSVRVTDWYTHK